ncbi:radical SAM protein [bacterium]|nr:radical SAM protein [bacterium]
MASVFNDFLDKIHSKKTYTGCKYAENSLFFDYNNKVKLCPYNDLFVVNDDFDGIWLNTAKVKNQRKIMLENFINNCHPQECKNCSNLKSLEIPETKTLKSLYLAHWKQCYLNCNYCNFPKVDDLIQAKHYDIYPVLMHLFDSKLIDKNTKIVFQCGDPCIHPEFDKILSYLINYEMKDIVINTPALRYCESIAEAIAKNIAEVIIPLDSGCAYIYEKIKGTNKFDIAMNNIRRYLSFQEPGEKRVILKYTVVNGINDNQKEILDWFIWSRDIGIKKLALEIERNWYNQIKNSVPVYLKELLMFAKNISVFNNLEIEFGENANDLYNKISKEDR